MTFFDLCKMVRHYWIVAVSIIVVCVFGAIFAFSCTYSPRYIATATIVAADPSGNLTTDQLMSTVQSLALNTEREMSAESVKLEGTLVKTTGSQYYEISATTPEAALSVETVNTAAGNVVNEAKAIYDAMQESADEKLHEYAINSELFEGLGSKQIDMINSVLNEDTYAFCQFIVEDAQTAKEQGSPLVRFVAAGIVIGILLAFCILAFYGYLRRPVMNRGSLENVVNVPVWGINPRRLDVLWANIQFSDDVPPESICLFPVSENTEPIANTLARIIEASGQIATPVPFSQKNEGSVVEGKTNIYYCESIGDDASSLWCARESDVTVICARQWRDKAESVEEAVQECELAKANLAGIAYLGK